jgi:hypothetical protein
MLALILLGGCARTAKNPVASGVAAEGQPAQSTAVRRNPGPALVQVTDPIERSHQPTTDAVILSRLEKVLADVPTNASVPRIALADVAYPRSQQELQALGGFALMLVTVVCHDSDELPVERVEARVGEQVVNLPLVNSRTIRVNSGRVARVFGGHRFDGVYLVPVFTTRLNARVVVHLRGGSASLEPLRFPPPPDQDNLPEGLRFDWDPRKPQIDALVRLLGDEFPVVPAKVRE